MVQIAAFLVVATNEGSITAILGSPLLRRKNKISKGQLRPLIAATPVVAANEGSIAVTFGSLLLRRKKLETKIQKVISEFGPK